MYPGYWGATWGNQAPGLPLGLAVLGLCLLAQNGVSLELPPDVHSGGQREVDLVLDCMFLEEKSGHLGAFASGFTHDSAILVLRGVRVTEGEHLDSYTDFYPQEAEDTIIFEAKGSLLDVVEAETILHADCNGQEVTCEISRYYAPSKKEEMENGQEGAGLRQEEQAKAGLHREEVGLQQEVADLQQEEVARHQEEVGVQQEELRPQHEEVTWASSWFVGYIQIPDGNFSITVVMKPPTNRNEGDGETKLHPRLKVPQSDLGTVPMSVDLSVFTRTPSLLTAIGQTVTLDCGLLSSDTAAVEWRIQHQGSGHSIYQYGPGETERAWRPGTEMNPQRLRDLGDASLTLADFGVKDEGTYICLVSTPTGHAQQIVRVQVQEPPRVTLSVLPLPHSAVPKTKLTCEMTGYYPLDVQVKWSQSSPGDGQEPLEISTSYSSSHRQNQDGTFSVTSSLDVMASAVDEEGTAYTCTITHVSLRDPITASVQLDPAAGSGHLLLGAFISSILVIIALLSYMTSRLQRQSHVTLKESEGQKLKVN